MAEKLHVPPHILHRSSANSSSIPRRYMSIFIYEDRAFEWVYPELCSFIRLGATRQNRIICLILVACFWKRMHPRLDEVVTFVSSRVVLWDHWAFLSPLQTRSFPYSKQLQNHSIPTLQLRSCLHYESFFLLFTSSSHILGPFWAECTVSSSPIARLRSFAHIFAYLVRLRSISAHSRFERSFCTFLKQLRCISPFLVTLVIATTTSLLAASYFPIVNPDISSKSRFCVFLTMFRRSSIGFLIYSHHFLRVFSIYFGIVLR